MIRQGRRLLRHLRYQRAGVECPVCGERFATFNGQSHPPNRICYGCGLMERHRYLWLWFNDHPEILRRNARVLHFAPEPALVDRLRALHQLRHVSVDIMMSEADVLADITQLPFTPGTFDLIICSHVMEHVEDELAALRSMRRVLSPDGQVIVMVPIDETKETTYEDASIVAPEDRQVAFWQGDHVRLYGRDIDARLAAGGFEVTTYRAEDLYDARTVERHQLWPREQILVLRPS